MPHLAIETGTDKGKTIPVPSEGQVTFGRDTSCSYQILDLSASRNHFRIVASGGQFRLEDQDSRNGTYLNDEKVGDAELEDGDLVRVGDTIFQFLTEEVISPADLESMGAKPKDPLVGKNVGGYEILEMIGRGGMGTVYKAKQVSLGRDVALKILSRRYTRDEKFVEMFVREARAAGALNHPNIVQVYDVGKDEDLHFFSMEHMARGTVGDMLKELGTISVPRALAMILHAAKGLEYAERRGIIHCDIKPDNLMLNDDGTVKIVDLGLSRTTMGERGEGDEGAVFGTPHFVAPEQAQRKKLDHRADIYSLGASFFLMITGYPVFLGDTAKEIVMKHIKEEPPKAKEVNPAIPESVSAIIDRMLKKAPDDRFESATSLLEDLKKANIEVNPQAAYTDGFPGIPAAEKPRPTGLIALGAAALLVLLAAFIVFPFLFGGEETPPVVDPGGNGGVEPGIPTDPNGTDPGDDEARRRLEEERRRQEKLARELAEREHQLSEEEAGKDLKAVMEFEKQRGLDAHLDPEVLAKYEALARKYPKTDSGKTAAARAKEMRAKQEAFQGVLADFKKEIGETEEAVRDLLKEERFGEAMKALEAFPVKKYEDTDAHRRVEDGKRFVGERAKDAWVLGTTSATSFERQGRFEEALAFYEKVRTKWKLSSYARKAETEIERIGKAAATSQEAAEKARIAADENRLKEAEKRAQRTAETTFDFLAAREEFRRLLPGSAEGSPLLTEKVRAKAKLLVKDFDHLVALKNRVIAQATRNKGKAKIRRHGRDVIVMGADQEYLEVSMGGAQTQLKWSGFKPQEFFRAASNILDPKTPGDHLRLGVLALVLGLVEEVEGELAQAEKEGDASEAREARRYLDRFYAGGGKAGRQLEAQARTNYDEIVSLFLKAEAEIDHAKAFALLREAKEKLEDLKKNYGQTQFVKEKMGN